MTGESGAPRENGGAPGAPDDESVQISVPARPEFVGVVRHVLGALARMRDLPDTSVDDLKLAVSEAVTNAISRQGAVGVDAPVSVVAYPSDGALTVVVTDSGAAFDPATYSGEPGDPDSEEFSFERGLSLPLVRGLVEDLEIAARAEGGMRVRFTLRAD